MRWIVIVLISCCTAAWAGPGKLAYVSFGTLWVRALPDGAPVAVAKGRIASLSWSPSGKWLAYREGEKLEQRKFLRVGGVTASALPPMTDWNWSPVADEIAYTTESGGLFLYDLATEHARTLVPAAAQVLGPVSDADPLPADADTYIHSFDWSPDGRSLACEARFGGLFLCDVSSGRLTWALSNAHGQCITEKVWSDDGRRLAYSVMWLSDSDHDQRGALSCIEADSTHKHRVVGGAFRPMWVQWTPDGRHLLYFYNEGFGLSGMGDAPPTKIISIDGGKPHRFMPDESVAKHPEFSPDGQTALVLHGSNRYGWSERHLSMIRHFGTERRFSPRGVNVFDAVWSPDGRTLACTLSPAFREEATDAQIARAMNERRIVLTPATRWQPRPLREGSPYCDENPQWTHDGSQLLVVRTDVKSSATALWLISADGQSARQVTPTLQTLKDSNEPDSHSYGADVDYAWWQGPPEITVQTPGLEYGNVNYLPLREMVEALGGTLDFTKGNYLRIDLPAHTPVYLYNALTFFPIVQDRLYLPARVVAQQLGLELSAEPEAIALSDTQHAVRVPVRHSPALAARAAGVHPLLFGGQYAGAVERGRWQSWRKLNADWLLMHRYTTYSLTGAHGGFRGGGLTLDSEMYLTEFFPDRHLDVKPEYLALSATWNAMPHMPQPLKRNDPRASALARETLREQKMPLQGVDIRQAYLVELGDGVSTLIVIARNRRWRDGEQPQPGDYAFIAARRNGKAQLLGGSFYTKHANVDDIYQRRLAGVLDVDGDGFAEIAAIDYQAMESLSIYRLKDGKLAAME